MRKRILRSRKGRIAVGVLVLLFIVTLLAFGCGHSGTIEHFSTVDHASGQVKASLYEISANDNAKDKATLNWSANITPNRWLIKKQDNGTSVKGGVVDGTEHSWVDENVSVGHAYVYDIVGEMDNEASPDKKEKIPFKRISINSPPGTERHAIQSAVTRQKSSDDLKREGDKYALTIRWNSPPIPDMIQWAIERRDDSTSSQPKELVRISPSTLDREFTDHELESTRVYYYDIVAIGNKSTAEGHPAEIRMIVKSLHVDVKEGAVSDIHWKPTLKDIAIAGGIDQPARLLGRIVNGMVYHSQYLLLRSFILICRRFIPSTIMSG